MTDLQKVLSAKVASGRKLFVPYVTAGLPSPQSFVGLIADLANFADAIEVGIPYSDPTMDGPIIQEASTRALAAGVTVKGSVALIREALRYTNIPIVVMTYFNPIHSVGVDAFGSALSESSVSGLIVPDLPIEESGPLGKVLSRAGIALIQMVAPTTPSKRVAQLAAASTGFVYAVSRMGVTGEQESLARTASEVVKRIRPHTKAPVLVGIGVSSGAQAAEACEFADGVIVGAAVMKRVLAGDIQGVSEFAKEVRRALALWG